MSALGPQLQRLTAEIAEQEEHHEHRTSERDWLCAIVCCRRGGDRPMAIGHPVGVRALTDELG